MPAGQLVEDLQILRSTLSGRFEIGPLLLQCHVATHQAADLRQREMRFERTRRLLCPLLQPHHQCPRLVRLHRQCDDVVHPPAARFHGFLAIMDPPCEGKRRIGVTGLLQGREERTKRHEIIREPRFGTGNQGQGSCRKAIGDHQLRLTRPCRRIIWHPLAPRPSRLEGSREIPSL
jgi:hypothetical protein